MSNLSKLIFFFLGIFIVFYVVIKDIPKKEIPLVDNIEVSKCLWSQIKNDSTIKFYDREKILYANWEYESEEEFSKTLLDSSLCLFFKDFNYFLNIESLEDSLSDFLSLINNETHVNISLFDYLPLGKQEELSKYIAKEKTKNRIRPVFVHFYLLKNEHQYLSD